MLRLGKLTDYAAIILGHLAKQAAAPVSTADVAAATRLPSPTVAKILKTLNRAGIVESVRGSNGGYKLACDADQITLLDIIEALEGPVALTTCIDDHAQACALEDICSMRRRWGPVNAAIRNMLGEMSLACLLDMEKDDHAVRASNVSRTKEEKRL